MSYADIRMQLLAAFLTPLLVKNARIGTQWVTYRYGDAMEWKSGLEYWISSNIYKAELSTGEGKLLVAEWVSWLP